MFFLSKTVNIKCSVTRDPTLKYIPIWQNLLAIFKLNLHHFDVLSLFCSCFLLLRENTENGNYQALSVLTILWDPAYASPGGSDICILLFLQNPTVVQSKFSSHHMLLLHAR